MRIVAQFGVEVSTDGTLTWRGQSQQLASCHAYVDTIGQIRDRATLTRVVGGALVAGPVGAVVGGLLRKRVDERECYLLITGEKDWAIEVQPSLAPRARTFAAWLNTQARERAELERRFAVAAAEGEQEKARMDRRRVGVYRSTATFAERR
jgi:hypothetical protein